MRTNPLIATLQDYFATTETPLVCAYLFGSFARGEDNPRSDVDIAVLFAGHPGPALLGPATTVRGEIERLLQRPVDLVDLTLAPVDLIHRVLRDGHLLVERDAPARVGFEVKARNEYFDLLPYLQAYRTAGATP